MNSKTAILGKTLDVESGNLSKKTELEIDRLVTHSVIFGMTGSGKTGLSICLLEELARNNVPLILIDPKGDLANLALCFPEMNVKSFEPWVSEQEARRQGYSTKEFAASKAEAHASGLGAWGLGETDTKSFFNKTKITIFTPGTTAGNPVNVLGAFKNPGVKDPEILRELIQGIVSGILDLAGLKADPIQSVEHVFLSKIFEQEWLAGNDLTLTRVIQLVQNPTFKHIGAMDSDSFISPRTRTKLATKLNGLLVSPSFQPWMKGAPLDIDQFMRKDDGRVPVSIFCVAHLDDEERMFFITLLLNSIVAWSRSLGGTSHLRGAIYFDEVMGYLPPHPKSPPSKRPILTLLKQARSVGIGCILATQNPVDIDYKAISNAGTWFIGRLQTPQDRRRVIEGLVSAVGGLDKKTLETAINNLQKRFFVMKEPGNPEPKIIFTRWAMSYLKGPLTLKEISTLHDLGMVELLDIPKEIEVTGTQVPKPKVNTADTTKAMKLLKKYLLRGL